MKQLTQFSFSGKGVGKILQLQKHVSALHILLTVVFTSLEKMCLGEGER